MPKTLNPHADTDKPNKSRVVTREITDEVFSKLRKLFKRTNPHANQLALLEEGRKPEHSVHTDEALKYWLAPFDHDKKKIPEFKSTTRIQAYINFTLLNKIEQGLEAPGPFNKPIDDAHHGERQDRVINTISLFCVNEHQVKAWCRPHLANTKPLELFGGYIELLESAKGLTEFEIVLREVLLEVVHHSGIERSTRNPTEGVEPAIAKLTSNAFDGLGKRPNWRGRVSSAMSEQRTASLFKEIGETLELPPFEHVGNI